MRGVSHASKVDNARARAFGNDGTVIEAESIRDPNWDRHPPPGNQRKVTVHTDFTSFDELRESSLYGRRSYTLCASEPAPSTHRVISTDVTFRFNVSCAALFGAETSVKRSKEM
jgi:hypothetical protein